MLELFLMVSSGRGHRRKRYFVSVAFALRAVDRVGKCALRVLLRKASASRVLLFCRLLCSCARYYSRALSSFRFRYRARMDFSFINNGRTRRAERAGRADGAKIVAVLETAFAVFNTRRVKIWTEAIIQNLPFVPIAVRRRGARDRLVILERGLWESLFSTFRARKLYKRQVLN